VAGIGNEQDHDLAMVVTLFERHSPRTRLNMTETRLGVDRDPPSGTANHRIPRTHVARNLERHLDPPG